MKNRRLRFGTALLMSAGVSLAAVGCGSASNSSSQAPASNASPASATPAASSSQSGTASDFYKGKTVTLIVANNAGSDYDLWARLVSQYLPKYLGAAKIDVMDVSGGGGIVGTDQLYNAKPDGLTIGCVTAAGDLFSQIAKKPGVTYDMTKFSWIGRPDSDPQVLAVRANGPYQTFDDLLHSKNTIRALSTGVGSVGYNEAVMTLNLFNAPYHMVTGFGSSAEKNNALVEGNGDLTSGNYSSDVGPYLRSGKAKVALLLSDKELPELPNVPTAIEEAQKLNMSSDKVQVLSGMLKILALGHAFAAPPGVPSDRLEALRQAFKQ
ncbi:MAG: hypothetical protein K6T31_01510, partial [Alicyclobacillus sp.]|nr:hypothetical protein [Alicyclobacillus sp.]